VRTVLQCRRAEQQPGACAVTGHSAQREESSKAVRKNGVIMRGKIIRRVISSCAMQMVDSLSSLTTLCNVLRQRWRRAAAETQRKPPSIKRKAFSLLRGAGKESVPSCYALCSGIVPKDQRFCVPLLLAGAWFIFKP